MFYAHIPTPHPCCDAQHLVVASSLQGGVRVKYAQWRCEITSFLLKKREIGVAEQLNGTYHTSTILNRGIPLFECV